MVEDIIAPNKHIFKYLSLAFAIIYTTKMLEGIF